MSTFNDNVISWLLEENNPAIAYRTKTNYLGSPHQKLLLWNGYTALFQMIGIKQKAYGIGVNRQINIF